MMMLKTAGRREIRPPSARRRPCSKPTTAWPVASIAATHKEETAESAAHIEIRAPASVRKLTKRDSDSVDSDDFLGAHVSAGGHQGRLKISRTSAGHGEPPSPVAKSARLESPQAPRLDQDTPAKGRPTQQAKYLKHINDLITASSDATAFMAFLREDGGMLAASLHHFEQKMKKLEQATALSGIGCQEDRTVNLQGERQKTLVVLQRLRAFGPALRALHAKEFLPMVVVAVFFEQLRVHGHIFPMDALT